MDFWKSWFNPCDHPSIIVVGLQEVISLESKRANAKLLIKSGGDSKCSTWLERMKVALSLVSPKIRYKTVLNQNLVGLLMVVFVREDICQFVNNISCELVKTGLGGYHGNKGSIVVRILLYDSSFCFINAHLAAGHSKIAERNSDVGIILKTPRLIPATVPCDQIFSNGGDGSCVEDMEHCVLFGDLNYRIDNYRKNVLYFINNRELGSLVEYDQLTGQVRNNPSFPLHSFQEGDLSFPPTYKFDPNSHEYDTSEKMRVPAWCDRILYRCNNGIESEHSVIEQYSSINDILISDHRPVCAVIRTRIRNVDEGKYAMTQKVLMPHTP